MSDPTTSYSTLEDGDTTVLNGQATLDLTHFGIPNQPCPCGIKFDIFGRPAIVDIQFPQNAELWNGLANNPESVRDLPLTVAMPDGRTMRARIAIFSGWHGDVTTTMWATFRISDSLVAHAAPHDGDHWRIRLTNIRIPRGDRTTRVATGKGITFRHDSVVFNVAGREWVLTDDWWERWLPPARPDTSKPLPSGLLETECKPDDTREGVEAIAEEIESLLRLALCRAITWVCCDRVKGGKVVESHYSSGWSRPFDAGGSQIISNEEPFQLKSFLETTHPRFVADRDWFRVTILLYTISRMSEHIEVRSSLQNTLLDRIAAKVLQDDEAAEIDAELPGRMTKNWVNRLHDLMLEASPHWTRDRTGQLTSSIKNWNSNPSFPGGVERAAMRLGLWPPSKAQLTKRHKLIHLGEYDASDGTSALDYWREIECLVTMMLLRVLGYAGPFYHLAIGHTDKLLSNLLLGGTERPPYRVQNVTAERLHEITQIAAYLRWIERNQPLWEDLEDWFPAKANIQKVLTQIEQVQTTKSTNEEDGNGS
jgi:hypothetical protein